MDKSKLQVLFFTLNNPLFGNGGENLRTRSALQILSAFCFVVVLTPSYIAYVDENLMYDFKTKLKSITILKSRTSKDDIVGKPSKNLAVKIRSWHWYSVPMYFCRSSYYMEKIKSLLEQYRFQLAWLDDDGFMGQFISFFNKEWIKVIYNTHNVQSRLNFDIEKNLDKMPRMINFLCAALHERLYFRKCDCLCYCSMDDGRYYRKIMKAEKLFYMPNTTLYEHKKTELPLNLPKKYIVWIGTMDVLFHAEGLMFF